MIEALHVLRSGAQAEDDDAVSQLYGTDIDSGAVNLTRFLLCTEAPGASPRARAQIKKNIRVADAMLSCRTCDPAATLVASIENAYIWQELFPQCGGTFDIILANPPFMKQRIFLQRYAHYLPHTCTYIFYMYAHTNP